MTCIVELLDSNDIYIGGDSAGVETTRLSFPYPKFSRKA